jgi:gluconolactonase
MIMATIANDKIEVFGKGVEKSEGVVIDKEGNVWGGGRNGTVYKVSPDGKVHEVCQLPEGSVPNGVALDRAGNFVYCDLGKQAVMKCSPEGKVSMIADRVGDVKLTLPNFCSYDAEGNLYISNSSTEDISKVLGEITTPSPKGALVRVRPDGKGDVIATGIYLANGTAIDPNEDAVYVLESTRNDCLRIQLKKDGTFGKPEIYSKDFPALPDGMAFDVDRNLYITLPAFVTKDGMTPANQVIKVDTNGKWTELINDPSGTKTISQQTVRLVDQGCKTCFWRTLKVISSRRCGLRSVDIPCIISGKCAATCFSLSLPGRGLG